MSGPTAVKNFARATIRSYSQIFFSERFSFALFLLFVSFFEPNAGLAGLLSTITANLMANFMGFNRYEVDSGLYGFNSLLVGLGIGYYFNPGIEMYLIVIASSIMTLFFVTFFKGILYKYGLPFLSLPFLFGIWTVLAASGSFEAIGISQKAIYSLNTLYGLGGNFLVNIYDEISGVSLGDPLRIYFNSLGAIFFQFSALAGIIIALGLLIFSRIAFLLSVYGFFIAYGFYSLLGGNIAELSYTYIGFNYILTAIAIGGFYLIPGRTTFLWLLLLIPLVTLVTLSLSSVFSVLRLSVYALPFNIIVLLFIYSLKFREKPINGLNETIFQQYKPERNLYSFHNQKTKEFNRNLVPIKLPFHGEWTVSQSHNGEYTHKEEWRHAFDFVITDKNGLQYKQEGHYPFDYYCFGKSVLAPANGKVIEVVDNIPDNQIGKMNIGQNWGNTVIIEHGEYLYSSLNHLKENSIVVKPGDRVREGQKLGEVGNSGRSPYPHLHFQLQATPSIGSKTLNYPVSHYLVNNSNSPLYVSYSIPSRDDKVSNISGLKFLKDRLDFTPGKQFQVEYSTRNKINNYTWEVHANAYNRTYILEKESGNTAYFVNNGCTYNFTGFYGKKASPLFYFYLSMYKILQADYPGKEISDEIPQDEAFSFPLITFQDFIAPFYLFLKSEYKIKQQYIDNQLQPEEMHFISHLEKKFFGKHIPGMSADIKIDKSNYYLNIHSRKNEIIIKIS